MFGLIKKEKKQRMIKTVCVHVLTILITVVYTQKIFAEDYRIEQINNEKIQTINFHPIDWPLAPPVIELNRGERLLLNFDFLEAAPKNFMYRIIHCKPNWEVSDIHFFDYAQGIDLDFIFDFQISRGQYLKYVNYSLVIPNENIQLKFSGNYALVVYDEDEKHIAFTKKFFVVERDVSIQANVKFSSVVSKDRTHQEVDFHVIPLPKISFNELTNSIQSIVVKNYAWNTASISLKPLYIRHNKIDYDYDDINNFEGGNEYRNLDLKNLNATNNNIERIFVRNDTPRVELIVDIPRYNKPYLNQPDINGRRLTKVQDPIFDQDIDAEYLMVRFRYYATNLSRDNLYIIGEFSNREIHDDFHIRNVGKNSYAREVILKQGFYNYMYITDENTGPTLAFTEGNYSETENEYTILVYYQKPGDFYHKLVGFESLKFP